MKPAAVVPVFALSAGLLVAPAAGAGQPLSGGRPATLVLPTCGESSPITETPVAGCSYVALPKRGGGVYYAWLTSGGEIRMTGSHTAGTLLFPASGQTWPAPKPTAASVAIYQNDVTGRVDGSGAMVLTVPYRIRVSMAGLGSCNVKGTADLSSEASDPFGGGRGSAYDPASQHFALAGASTAAPEMTGTLCTLAGTYLDLSGGLGWYLEGRLTLTPGTTSRRAQTATVKVPAHIKPHGRTVLLAGPVRTNADQRAATRVTWATNRKAGGTNEKYARVRIKGGKVIIRTTGRAKRLYVRLRLRAPATVGYRAYTATRTWVVRAA